MKMQGCTETLILEEFIKKTRKDHDLTILKLIKDAEILKLLQNGKRLRPIMSVLSYKVCTQGKETQKIYQEILLNSVSIELAHTASLIHDDIIDKDIIRRGKTALYVNDGIPNAILTGHKLLAKGFELSLKSGKKFSELYVKTWNESIKGELIEININNLGFSNINNKKGIKNKLFEQYYEIIDLKTASLFSAACKAGALKANASDKVAKLLEEYGREFGFAYQLADDLLDFENGEKIDSVLIPIFAKIYDKKIDTQNLEYGDLMKKIAKNRSKIKEMLIDEINKHLEKCSKISNSGIIPESEYKQILKEIPRYFINKFLEEIKIKV